MTGTVVQILLAFIAFQLAVVVFAWLGVKLVCILRARRRARLVNALSMRAHGAHPDAPPRKPPETPETLDQSTSQASTAETNRSTPAVHPRRTTCFDMTVSLLAQVMRRLRHS